MSETRKNTVNQPKYQQVAIDIAERIVEGRYNPGEKVHARSTLATHFNVSPETARKAISILVDLGIMEVKHGSGAFVASKEKAIDFVTQFQNVQTVQYISNTMKKSISTQRNELNKLEEMMNQLLVQTKKAKNHLPFVPFEIELSNKARNLDKNINELNFWHQTQATIVAIQSKDELILSPGPYAKLTANTKLYFVGSEEAYQRVNSFFYEV